MDLSISDVLDELANIFNAELSWAYCSREQAEKMCASFNEMFEIIEG